MLSNVPLTPIAEALTRPKLRDQAYQYLVELAPGRSSLFTPQLEDPDPRVRADAVDILALAGDAAALPLVERLLADRDSQVVKAAERAVARLRALQRKPIRRPIRAIGVIGDARNGETTPIFLRASHSGRRARSAGQGTRSRTARRSNQRRHRRSGGVHRRRRSGVSRGTRSHAPERADVRRTRPRLRVPQLRHPLDDEHRDRGEGIAGGGVDSRARANRRARGDAAPARRGRRRSRTVSRPRQSDQGDADHSHRECRRPPRAASLPRRSPPRHRSGRVGPAHRDQCRNGTSLAGVGDGASGCFPRTWSARPTAGSISRRCWCRTPPRLTAG